MTEEAEQVMARMTGKGIICPDCGKVCTTIDVEKYENRLFRLDMENKVIFPEEDSRWHTSDYAYRCPQCGSLNMDSELNGFTIKKEE